MKKVASVVKKVVSVLTAPLRAIGRVLPRIRRTLPKIMRSLRRLRTPLVKLGQLRGRALVVACGASLAVLVLAVIVLKPGPNEEERVRETLDRFADASRDKDYQALCDDLLASELVDRIRSAGLPCEVALRTGLENRRNPTLTVLGVEVNGDQALAGVRGTAVGEPAGTSTYRLVREDGSWRIATSPGTESQSPGAVP